MIKLKYWYPPSASKYLGAERRGIWVKTQGVSRLVIPMKGMVSKETRLKCSSGWTYEC